jgi:ribosome recycling factor
VHFPELTTETREKIAKAAKSKHEDARVTLRGHRDEIRSDVQKKQKDGYISEDEARDQLDKVEELTLKYNKEFDDIYETKYKELTTI